MSKKPYMPLVEALLLHKEQSPLSYHVPGHKNGFLYQGEETVIFREIARFDQTELSGLDDLHAPAEAIMEAENLLSNLYKTKKSFFLVNGSTVGNLSMILASFNEGDQVLVQRNSHQSIMNGLELANVSPIFITPEMDHERMTTGGISFDSIKTALQRYPNLKGIILTYPNYYGVTYDLKSIIELAHSHRIPVLVDEAHGAHFIAGDIFPASAIELGADIVVHSAHKTLPAMTMGSYLHYNSQLVSLSVLEEYLHILQSSSPSYPIMASLDAARAYLEGYHANDLDYLEKQINSLTKGMEQIGLLKTVKHNPLKDDLLKISVQSKEGIPGFVLQKAFEQEGVFTEMADLYNVLFAFPLLKYNMNYPIELTLSKLKRALDSLQSENTIHNGLKDFPLMEPYSEIQLSYRELRKADKQSTEIEKAVGRISLESIIPYPPGIPLLHKGEKITDDHIHQLENLLKAGAKFHGGELLKYRKIITTR